MSRRSKTPSPLRASPARWPSIPTSSTSPARTKAFVEKVDRRHDRRGQQRAQTAWASPGVVCHPQGPTPRRARRRASSESRGCPRRSPRATRRKVSKHTPRAASTGILLETTAGQGTTLGWRFEHLAEILAKVKDNSRLGVCFDTCHVFAAGYKISTKVDYRATMKQFDKIVGLDQIRAFHLNDGVKGCGSRCRTATPASAAA